MSIVVLSGVSLEYEWVGVASNVESTLVFLHEGLGSISAWRDFPDALCQANNCRGFVYSRRGHGGSGLLTEAHPVDNIHREALTVLPTILERFLISRPVLFGHSDGASIALICAGSGIGPIAGLILEAPHVFVEDATVNGIEATKDRFKNGNLRERLRRHHGDNVDSLFAAWTTIWLSPDFRSWNIEKYLPGIRTPTLIFQGSNDEYGTEKQVEAIARAIGPSCETVMLEACGHSPHVDRRAVVEERVGTFLRRDVNFRSNTREEKSPPRR